MRRKRKEEDLEDITEDSESKSRSSTKPEKKEKRVNRLAVGALALWMALGGYITGNIVPFRPSQSVPPVPYVLVIPSKADSGAVNRLTFQRMLEWAIQTKASFDSTVEEIVRLFESAGVTVTSEIRTRIMDILYQVFRAPNFEKITDAGEALAELVKNLIPSPSPSPRPSPSPIIRSR